FHVTGVQTCALPISCGRWPCWRCWRWRRRPAAPRWCARPLPRRPGCRPRSPARAWWSSAATPCTGWQSTTASARWTWRCGTGSRRPTPSIPDSGCGCTRGGGRRGPPPQPTTPPPVTSNVAWRWPTEGQVASRFAAGDPTRQGIDIVGRSGQPVRAAADGVVVYSGSGLVGYGELVIVKHDEQWLSAYGHNRTRLVNEGARVKAGQQIAEMGSTGAARDMLHFEIRYNGKPVDPLQYLPRR